MRTTKHEVDVNDLITWKNDTETRRTEYAHDQRDGRNKRLYATLDGGFQVVLNGEIVLECTQPYQAVEKYNSL